MKLYVITAAVSLLIGMFSVGVPAVLFAKMRERAFDKVSADYERIVAKADERVEVADKRLATFMDRWYEVKNLPPGEIDMNRRHEERREEEREKRIERQNGRPIPARIGLVDDVQRQMEEAVRDGKYAREPVTAKK